MGASASSSCSPDCSAIESPTYTTLRGAVGRFQDAVWSGRVVAGAPAATPGSPGGATVGSVGRLGAEGVPATVSAVPFTETTARTSVLADPRGIESDAHDATASTVTAVTDHET
jgi:hypothetical protein